MTLRNFLLVAAILSYAFGVAFVLFPVPLLALYGVTLDESGLILGQLFGAALIGFGTINWLARRIHEHEEQAVRAILLGNLETDALGFVLSLLNQLAGRAGINALGWSTVAIFLLLGLAAAYFLYMPRARPVAGAPR